MNNAKYTPGPWSWWPLRGERRGGVITEDKAGGHICQPIYFENHPDITSANARLIAAAPEMYEALMEIYAGNLDGEDYAQYHERARRVARAALDKAEGR